jgi:glutamine amidotransferase-like uncharacterized protein
MSRDLRAIVSTALVIGFVLFGCNGTEATERTQGDVALYSDAGCWQESVQAAQKMFEWMGNRVTLVDAQFINRNSLEGFKLLCIPGGDMYQYGQSLSASGKGNITGFVRSGGAYIGICGGAYFAATRILWQGTQLPMTPLGLYAGAARGPVDEIVPYPDFGMTTIRVVEPRHSITRALPDSVAILYYWGPELLPDDGAGVSVLGTYVGGGRPAMLAFSYGAGRVFLLGLHAEIEEDSDRDGVSFADSLDDAGSDWDLMKSAYDWCVER